jgi:hypothetical protein
VNFILAPLPEGEHEISVLALYQGDPTNQATYRVIVQAPADIPEA